MADNNGMVITYYGGDCFKVQFADTVVAVNPIAKGSTLKAVRFGADIALVGANVPDYNGVEQVESSGRELFTIDGPGEYEVKGVVVKGYAAPYTTPRHTFYFMTLEGINMCFLTGLASTELSKEMSEELGEVDILFVPIVGERIDPAAAYKQAVALEPSYIIPMHYGTDTAGKEALQLFLKEGGVDGAKPVDKFTVKRRDVDGAEGEIVILAASAQ